MNERERGEGGERERGGGGREREGERGGRDGGRKTECLYLIQCKYSLCVKFPFAPKKRLP